MTHDELLNNIKRYEDWAKEFYTPGVFNALRAVVELHKPEPLDERGDVCFTCCPDLLVLYPCPTIQDIDKYLNPQMPEIYQRKNKNEL
jgi:hypothetical protein